MQSDCSDHNLNLFIKNLDKKREEKSIIDDEKLTEDNFLNLC